MDGGFEELGKIRNRREAQPEPRAQLPRGGLSPGLGIGDGGERTLAKAVRAHGNAAETIPLALFLMLLAELVGVAAGFLHAMGVILVLARAWHAYGLSRRAGMSPGRFVGMTTTFVVIIALAVAAFARIV
jgi:uncharacterized membrane protein YecN with MAPEG domain